MKIANRDAGEFAAQRLPFTGSNLFGQVIDETHDVYAVFSYGHHFPLYVWVKDRWFANTDSRSQSTSRHYSQARPVPHYQLTPLNTEQMKVLVRDGYTGLVALRLKGVV